MESINTTFIQKFESAPNYCIASLIALLIGSLCQLVVVDWLIFGSPDGPMWVGFFAPLGFCFFVLGCGIAAIGQFRTRRTMLWIPAGLNAVLICAFFGACLAYVVFSISLHRQP